MKMATNETEVKFQSFCIICGSAEFWRLPSPWLHSITTAGTVVEEPLAKAQCSKCTLLIRAEVRKLGDTDFYEKHYSYYHRPGASLYDAPRYEGMANWIKSAITDFEPKTCLDAGCGRGWMIQAMTKVFPSVSIAGVEPSEEESANAQKSGLHVVTGKINKSLVLDRQFDFIYSTNVIQHTTDPLDFLISLKEFLTDDGRIVVICPNSTEPSHEMMFSDQNYSFSPTQLIDLAKLAGLHPVRWESNPDVSSLQNKQLLILSKNPCETFVPPQLTEIPSEQLYADRNRYVMSYVHCDDYLCAETENRSRIYNFGSSSWSLMLRSYCPKYWERVYACTIDEVGSSDALFHAKPVQKFADIVFREGDALVLGVNPLLQKNFNAKLAKAGIHSICWDQLITR